MPKHVAVYVRVSSKQQDHRSQLPDLKRWGEAQDEEVKFYEDKATGKNMDRPGWERLRKSLEARKVSQIVVWRLDRLGRTAAGLTALFEELRERKVNLVSIKDSIDLSTPAGRLMANVLASVAAYETEIRGERVRAGQAVARKNGKRWGGSVKGTRKVVTPTQIKMVHRMKLEHEPIKHIAQAVGLSIPTIYSILADAH